MYGCPKNRSPFVYTVPLEFVVGEALCDKSLEMLFHSLRSTVSTTSRTTVSVATVRTVRYEGTRTTDGTYEGTCTTEGTKVVEGNNV